MYFPNERFVLFKPFSSVERRGLMRRVDGRGCREVKGLAGKTVREEMFANCGGGGRCAYILIFQIVYTDLYINISTITISHT